MEKSMTLIGRLLMAHIFILAGISKMGAYEATQGYMAAMGVPGLLLPLVILLEVGGGLALLLGWQTRWAALALAGFSAVAAIIFHHNFADQMQMILFMKNWAMVGGLLYVYTYGAGSLSLDAKFARR